MNQNRFLKFLKIDIKICYFIALKIQDLNLKTKSFIEQ